MSDGNKDYNEWLSDVETFEEALKEDKTAQQLLDHYKEIKNIHDNSRLTLEERNSIASILEAIDNFVQDRIEMPPWSEKISLKDILSYGRKG